MIRIVLGSTNPVKIESVRQAFAAALGGAPEVAGIAVPSGVAEQPLTDEETLRGARNRAHGARQRHPEADFWVGVEGGVDQRDGRYEAFGWVFVLAADHHSSARSATFPLPPAVGERLRRGEELGPIIDDLFNEHNSKHKGGAVGLLTRGLVSREALYHQPLLLALTPFMQPRLFG